MSVKTKDEEEINFKELVNFLHIAVEGLEWGEHKAFVCPICGGKAESVRATRNGHPHAICHNCGMNVMA